MLVPLCPLQAHLATLSATIAATANKPRTPLITSSRSKQVKDNAGGVVITMEQVSLKKH